MLCHTLEKQNEIINEFLDGIEANGMIHKFKTYLNAVVLNMSVYR